MCCECEYEDEPFHEYVPTLRDWAAYRLRPLKRLGGRVKRWWKYSVLKKPRPHSKSSLRLHHLDQFDAFLKEIYPVTTIESVARMGYPNLSWNANIMYGEPRTKDE